MDNHPIFFIVPGYGNSDETHWQTYFESQLPNSQRIIQKSWDKPSCDDWVNKLNMAVNQHNTDRVVLVSHSLGGIAVAHWASRFKTKIKGAFIVAPPDIENPYMELGLQSFAPIPTEKLLFPSIVVGSTNDNWASVERTRYFASNWGSSLILIDNAGHINSASGFGAWNEGLKLLLEEMG